MTTPLLEDAKFIDSLSGTFAPHAHPCYEVLYLKMGTLIIHVAQRVYTVNAPSLIFVSKFEQHSLTVEGDAYQRYYLCISPTAAEAMIRDYTLLTVLSHRPENFCHVLDVTPLENEIDRIFDACVNEVKTPLPYTNQRQAALISELLILLFRFAPSLFSMEKAKTISVIWKIQSELEANCRESFSLNRLAEQYHMSPYYLSHLFKDVTGYSVMQYLTLSRLSLARQMVLETDLPVTEIVYASGFSDCSNFSRLFKREMHLSATEYRKEHKT